MPCSRLLVCSLTLLLCIACNTGLVSDAERGHVEQETFCWTDSQCAIVGDGYTCEFFVCQPPPVCIPRSCEIGVCGIDIDDGCGGVVTCGCGAGDVCTASVPGHTGECHPDAEIPPCPAEREWPGKSRFYADQHPLGDLDGQVISLFGSSKSALADGLAFGCDSSPLAREVVFRFNVRSAATFVFETRGSSYDTVLGLFKSPVLTLEHFSKLACDHDNGPSGSSRIEQHLEPGTYYLVLSSSSLAQKGDYRVLLSAKVPECQIACPEGPTTAAEHIARLQCFDKDTPLCDARVQGQAKADKQAAAEQFVSRTMNSAEHIALVRDRTRKLRAAEADPSLMQKICDGDADGDFVPDSRDDCPGTADLRATDDRGCEVEQLPPAVPDEMIHAVLEKIGAVHDPACTGATSPISPIPLPAVDRSTFGTYRFLLRPPSVDPAPPDCNVWYLFEGTITLEDGTQRLFRFLLNANDPRITPLPTSNLGDLLLIQVHTSEGPEFASWGDNAQAMSYRVRALNGAGQRSAWSAPVNVQISQNSF